MKPISGEELKRLADRMFREAFGGDYHAHVVPRCQAVLVPRDLQCVRERGHDLPCCFNMADIDEYEVVEPFQRSIVPDSLEDWCRGE